MLAIGNMCRLEEIPETVQAINDENIEMLEKFFGTNINGEISLSEYSSAAPLTIAILLNKKSSIRWFVKNGADLNDNTRPSFQDAARFSDGDILEFLSEAGADIHACNNVGCDAFKSALYGKRMENIRIIDKLGHKVSDHGVVSLRSAVSDNDMDTVKLLLELGVDINGRESDMVCPFAPTALCTAANYGNLEMVKFLVENGADCSLKDTRGSSPYTFAFKRKANDVVNYLRPFTNEPSVDLKKFKIPSDLKEFLSGNNLRVELKKNDFDVNYFEFLSLSDIYETKIGRRKMVQLSKEFDNYGLDLVWDRNTLKIACYDVEHGTFTPLASFKKFMKAPESYVEKMIEG